uniref:ArsR family transcriptional regulator n=1 Tax=Archaeoglobus fulgidus TaxID=2234 RepID=A0A7J2TJ81_ARCFL
MSSWKEFSGSIELSREYHERYHRAIASPVRRKILKLLALGFSEDEIMKELGISRSELDYHIKVLIRGFCVEKIGERFVLTKEGKVVERFQD